MKKNLLMLIIIPLFLFTPINEAQASKKVMWGKTELKTGVIGKITVQQSINLWKDNNKGKLEIVRVLNPNEEYRVYGYRDLKGGQYNVGGGNWVTKIPSHIKYETPSKAKLALVNTTEENKGNPEKEFLNVWENNRLIAHAMGAIDGKTYSNSLESFEYNYSLGYRLFEVDFSLTSDGRLVARHDWRVSLSEIYQQVSPTLQDTPWTYEYFMNQKIYKEYSPLDIDGVIKLMQENKDMYIVTDTKEFQRDAVINHFQLIVDAAEGDPKILNRVIPQIYNQNMLTDVKSVYDFPEVVYTLYMSQDNNQQVIDFVKEKKIKMVTMPEFRVEPQFISKLKESGAYTFVHTINSREVAKKYNDYGVYGFYSDILVNQDLKDLQRN